MYFKYTISETIRKPEKELEPFILRNVKTSYEYCKKILKKRWVKAEDSIVEICQDKCPWIPGDLEYVYLYSKNIIKSRWKKGEDLFLKYFLETEKESFYGSIGNKNFLAKVCCSYAKNVIKGRWKEVEEYVIQTNQIENYINVLKNEKELEEFYRVIKLQSLRGGTKISDHAKNFSLWKPTHLVKIKGSKAFKVMILKNPCFSKRDNEHELLVFNAEEWLDQADQYNSSHQCRTYYSIKANKTSSDELSKELYGGVRSYRKKKIEALITEI